MTNFRVRKATDNDVNIILNMYKSVIGTKGCTWNNNYPGIAEIEEDLSANNLFVGTIDNQIIGAVSVVHKNELNNKSFWHIQNQNQHEIARVVVRTEYQGKGYAKSILSSVIEILKNNNCSSIHLIVAKQNLSAINLYKKLGFLCVGDCRMYDNDYYAFEKII